MELMLMRMFQRQVADQCKVTLHGVSLLDHGLQNANHDTVWIGAQVLLTGAANTSKALWGGGRERHKISAEREPLRRSLQVEDSSPLSDVRMRNNFEHYDERLDKWWQESPQHNHLDRLLGPPESVSGLNDIDRFRVYDPTTHDIVFWGERFNVQAIATAVSELLPRAEAEANKPHWET